MGLTPLSNAIRRRHKAFAGFLLHSGADPNIPDHNGGTPIFYAAVNGDVDLLRALMKAKANVNHLSEGSRVTALQLAVEKGHQECATTLLLAGATVHGGINDFFSLLTKFVDPTLPHRIQTSNIRKSIASDLGTLACLCMNCDDLKEEQGIAAFGAIKKRVQLVSAALEKERKGLLSELAPAMNNVTGVMKIVFEYARIALVEAIERIPK